MSAVLDAPADPVDSLPADPMTNQPAGQPSQLQTPEATRPYELMKSYAAVLLILHAVAATAIWPWLFTWSGLVVGIAGHFFFGMLGITIGYHRLLTHQGFTCPKWLERSLAVLGVCNLQDSPARWVAIHRMHHQHSDHQPDPHTPLAGFLWGHIGWVIYRHRDLDTPKHFERYVRDLLRDPFYLALERSMMWFFIYAGHAVLIATAGGAFGYLTSGGDWSEAWRYYCSWMVWGVAVRTVFVLHGTWAVNSFAHMFGYRNYETREESRNNAVVALLTHGEGWHNNHHAYPRSAMHGHRWWEMDMSWWVIRSWEAIGLVKNVQRPKTVKG